MSQVPETEKSVLAIVVKPEQDNVAIAVKDLTPGHALDVAGMRVIVQDAVPAGHPLAIQDIPKGQPIMEYGQPWAISRGVRAGKRITPDVIENRLPESAHAVCTAVQGPGPLSPDESSEFQGYVRSDGRVGTRNYVVVCPTSMCADHEASRIATWSEQQANLSERYPHVDGIVALPHNQGCGCSDGQNITNLLRTLANTVDHPNVAAAILIDLGCEKTPTGLVEALLRQGGAKKPIEVISIQGIGGTQAAIRRGLEVMPRLLEAAEAARRTHCPAARLTLGTECGGSDAFSGLSANPALGFCSDRLVRCGGAVVLGEVPEICGAEQLLTGRCRSRELADRVMAFADWFREQTARLGQSPNENPSPGNKEGGLMNIFQKSLGAVIKAGTTPVEDVLDYAEKIRRPGLTLMQSPGNDPESLAGLVAGGITVCGFTTGRGTTIGNPICPVIKIATNTPMYQRMQDDMDINAGSILEGRETVQEVGQRIFDMVLKVVSGQKTASERLGHREFQIWGCDRIAL